jgi:hypothetical protein
MKEIEQAALRQGEDGNDLYAVNHRNDNPGFITCEAVPKDDDCFKDHECVIDPRCPDQDGDIDMQDMS